MNCPIEIKVNSSVIEELILKSIEQSIPVIPKQEYESLKCINSKAVMNMLGIGKKSFDSLVSSGILRPLNIGTGFRFSMWQIEKFQQDYQGMDLTTYEKCVIAKQKVDAGTPTKN